MNAFHFKKVIFGVGCSVLLSFLNAESPAQPNIIIVLADDMGYSDSQPYGSEIETPHLTTLAQSGLRFTGLHNCAKCSPSRAALMTGLYPQQVGMANLPKENKGKKSDPEGAGELSQRAITLAELLKTANYSTYMVGKWHLTGQFKPANEAAKFNWPLQRGFDHFFGFIEGKADSYFNLKDKLVSDNEFLTEAQLPKEFYLTDLFFEKSCEEIKNHAKQQPASPFFLYVAPNAPHWPIMAKPEDVEHYKNTYKVGWDVIREQRFERQKKLGVIPSLCSLSPRNEGVPAWDTLKEEKKAEYALAMATYAGMITCMDRGIGRLMAALDETGLRENTIVIFLSDNGACAEGETNMKGKDPLGNPLGRIGSGWANVGNTPFRFWKNTTWEGGSVTEAIVNWPRGLASSLKGGITTGISHVIDFMPTCVEVTGATYPTQSKGKITPRMEGISFLPLLRGQPMGERELFWKFHDYESALSGSWKITREKISESESRWSLFDLKEDPSEINDIAQNHSEVVQSLSSKWQSWYERVTNETVEKSPGS